MAIRKIIKDGYVINLEGGENLSKEDLADLANRAVKLAKKQETLDEKELEDALDADIEIDDEEIDSLVKSALGLKKANPEETDQQIIDRLFAAMDIGPGAYSSEEMAKIEEAIKKALSESASVEDIKINDIPVNSPEEQVSITFNEKLKGGKSALTYGMIEEAFKQRNKDDGQTFRAYVDVAIDSLKEDIANAKYIVSGEMKPVRKLLLEDYIKVEGLCQKAGLTDKADEMRKLTDELSEKLDLNYWKQPKFKKSTQRKMSQELRNKHRWDSTIAKTVKPIFLVSESDLRASYNDAKQGKLPEVFEANLKKISKDIQADYDRINNGRDHYLEDPRIVQVLPEIIDMYELATKFAEDLGYKDTADWFKYMLVTIKKGWGLD